VGGIPLEPRNPLACEGRQPDADHVDFPTIVKEAVDVFGDLFAQRTCPSSFCRIPDRLMVAEKKTVSGINSAFVVTTDQSCLNRWLERGDVGRQGPQRPTLGMVTG